MTYTAVRRQRGFRTIDCRQKTATKALSLTSPRPHSSTRHLLARSSCRAAHQRRSSTKQHKVLENLIFSQDATEKEVGCYRPGADLNAPVPEFLQLAFSEMKDDIDVYDAEEALRDNVVQLLHSTERNHPRDDAKRAAKTHKALRPFAPAATHPYCYKQVKQEQQHHTKLMHTMSSPPISPSAPAKPKSLPPPKSKPMPLPPKPMPHPPPPKPPVLPPGYSSVRMQAPRTYTDPKRLQSGQPVEWTNLSGHLHMDKNETQPKVLSLVEMVGLPFGGQIEMANHYD